MTLRTTSGWNVKEENASKASSSHGTKAETIAHAKELAKKEQLEEAANHLATVVEKHSRLGHYFSKYGISATMSLPITDEVSVHAGPDLRGVLLGLVEVYQRQGRWEDAIACLERLQRLESDDVVVKPSLAELLLDVRPGDKNMYGRT